MMEQSEIARRNKAIAKYMMWKEATKENFRGAKVPVFTLETEFAPITLKEADFSFHNDWSWLMPVVEKICDTRDTAYHSGKSFKGGWFARFGMDNNSYGDTPIEAAWMAASDYILSREK